MKASQVQVFLFDGERRAVQGRVNEFLRTLGQGGSLEPDIAAIGYNYQGSEWDGRVCIDGSASHGLMLIACYPAINEVRAARGIDPLAAQPGAEPQDERVMVLLEDFLRSLADQAPNPQKKPWWVRAAKRMLRR